jgi:hypothetical protein
VPAETQLRLVAEQMPALLWTADRELRIPDDGRNAQELLEVADRQLRPTLALAEDVEGETISEVAVIILPSATIPGTNGWQRFRMLQNPDIARRFAQ